MLTPCWPAGGLTVVFDNAVDLTRPDLQCCCLLLAYLHLLAAAAAAEAQRVNTWSNVQRTHTLMLL
jgi:hypothetical protein